MRLVSTVAERNLLLWVLRWLSDIASLELETHRRAAEQVVGS